MSRRERSQGRLDGELDEMLAAARAFPEETVPPEREAALLARLGPALDDVDTERQRAAKSKRAVKQRWRIQWRWGWVAGAFVSAAAVAATTAVVTGSFPLRRSHRSEPAASTPAPQPPPVIDAPEEVVASEVPSSPSSNRASSRLAVRRSRPRAGPSEIIQPADPMPALRATIEARDCPSAEQQLETLPARIAASERAHAVVSVANCYQGSERFEDALRLYRVAAARYPRTVPGENATYEVGRVALRLTRPKEAADAFRSYLKRNPRGVLAAEATFRLCSLAMEAERNEEALACVRDYRKKHPSGERVAEAHFLEATILRTARHDCRGALEAYEKYLERPGELRKQAEGWRQWCLDELRESQR